MCCSSSMQTFSWIGAILVNVGFIYFISWGAATLWLLGFFLSGAYTAFLFWLAKWLEQFKDRQQEQLRLSEQQQEQQDDTNELDLQPLLTTNYEILSEYGRDTNQSSTNINQEQRTNDNNLIVESNTDGIIGVSNTNTLERDAILNLSSTSSNTIRVPIIISLLYGLAVLSMGVTGFFLPVNLVKDCNDWNDDNNHHHHHHNNNASQWDWRTNLTDLPRELRDWAAQDSSSYASDDTHLSSFGYVEATDTTLFKGSHVEFDVVSQYESNGRIAEYLWISSPSSPPRQHSDYLSPSSFVAVSTNDVCFVAYNRGIYKKSNNIYCTDGNSFKVSIDSTKRVNTDRIGWFHPFQDSLWFKQVLPDNNGNDDEIGTLIFSLDTESMNIALHSYRERINRSVDRIIDVYNANGNDCNEVARTREFAIFSLFVTAIPVILASIAIWFFKFIPSMGTTLYVGLTMVYLCMYFIIHPKSDGVEYHKYWFAVSGLIGLLLFSYLYLLNSLYHSRDPLRWGLTTSGMAFLWGMTIIVMKNGQDTFAYWFLLNFLVFVPLIACGIVTDTVFLLFFGAIGFFADASRFAMYVGDKLGDANGVVPLQFIIFGISGLGIGILGYLINKYQDQIKAWAEQRVQHIHVVITNFFFRRRGEPAILA